MKPGTLIGLALVAGAGWYLFVRRDPRTGAPLLNFTGTNAGVAGAPIAGWGAGAPAGQVYDPRYAAAGSPSYAGSYGTGNMNPITTIATTISNILAKAIAPQPVASAPVNYGKPASPAAPTGPTSTSQYLAMPLNRSGLVDPAGWYGDPTWIVPSSQIEGDFVWNAQPPDISAQAQGDVSGLGLFY